MGRGSRRGVGSTGAILGSAPELDDSAAIAFGGARCRQLFELPHGFAFSGDFLAEVAAGVGLAVEGLGDRGGAANVTEE